MGSTIVPAGGDGVDVARPTSLGYRPGLDGLRGLAVVLVLLMHAGETVWPEAEGWLAPGGAIGVDMFLVLSGFLITALLLTERERTGAIDIGAFARRRARRLLPGLVAVLAAVAAVAVLGSAIVLRDVAAAAVQVLTFLTHIWSFGNAPGIRDLVESIGTPTTDVGHLWTIGLEVQFYALWGLTLWWASRARWSHRRLLALAAVGVVVVAVVRIIRMELGPDPTFLHLYVATTARLDAPLVGSIVGVAWCAGLLDRVPSRLAAGAAAVGFAGWLVGALTLDPYQSRALPYGLYTVMALGCAGVVVGVLRAPATGVSVLLASRPVRFLGLISYSVYLFHLPVLRVVARSDLGVAGPAQLVVAAGVTVGVAWLSYRFVERPWLSRRPAARSGLQPAPAAAVP